MKRVLVLHGPSLALLGTREPAVYGRTTLAEIDAALVADGKSLGLDVRCLQTNHEGAFIDEIVGAPAAGIAGLLVNPGAWSHTSLAIADAIRAVALPVVEVHLTNTSSREEIRRVDVVGAACLGRVEGFGADSYRWGLRALAQVIDRAGQSP